MIARITADWVGTQVAIQPAAQPAFRIILFHVVLDAGLDSGSVVTAGQRLGHHIGSQTMTDVAVSVNTPAGFRLVSWFDAMADQVFSAWAARGITSRQAMVITKAERDQDPLGCDGETFTGPGSLESWWQEP